MSFTVVWGQRKIRCTPINNAPWSCRIYISNNTVVYNTDGWYSNDIMVELCNG